MASERRPRPNQARVCRVDDFVFYPVKRAGNEWSCLLIDDREVVVLTVSDDYLVRYTWEPS